MNYVEYDECEGKVVKGIGIDGERVVVAFQDDSFTSFYFEIEYDDSIDFRRGGCECDLLDYKWSTAAEDAGAITREQWLESYRQHKERQLKYAQLRVESLKADLEKRP